MNTAITLGPNYTIASASGHVSIVVHMGRFGARDKQFGSSWTIVPVNP
ncbi:MAG: hypothetical protein JO104_06775 [Candidatus Eremiobacteraeota bacterium]|nr:hypothetical protein [Candidatus Eremiobacteraeota bacterium]